MTRLREHNAASAHTMVSVVRMQNHWNDMSAEAKK